MENIEKAYSTKEVSMSLDIGTSTLRKWCLALEENGYEFIKGENGRRLFVERDLVALRYFQKLVKGENFSLKNAAKVITSKYHSDPSESVTTSVLPEKYEEEHSMERYDVTLKKIIAHVNNQEEFNKKLIDRLDQQQKYIEERLNKRDEVLMRLLNESLETKKMIVAAQEEEKKGFWARLFKRD